MVSPLPSSCLPLCLSRRVYYFAEVSEVTDIYKILLPVKGKWEEIGSSLGLSDEKLDQIKTDKNSDAAPCLYATIDAWIQKRDVGRYRPTWQTLFRALDHESVNEPALTKQIKEEKGRSCSYWNKLSQFSLDAGFKSAQSFLPKPVGAKCTEPDEDGEPGCIIKVIHLTRTYAHTVCTVMCDGAILWCCSILHVCTLPC